MNSITPPNRSPLPAPHPGRSDPPHRVYRLEQPPRHPLATILGALLLTAAVFLVLPLSQMLSTTHLDRQTVTRVDLSLPPPPPPPPISPPNPPPDQAPTTDPPQLEPERPRLTLDQLALALNPTLGGAGPNIDTSLSFAVQRPDPLNELKVFEISEVDRPASVTFYPRLAYPASLRRERIVGTATLIFVVNADGSVNTIEDISDVSHPDFIPIFRNWVKRWRFEPATKNGEPVPQRVRQAIQVNPS